MPIYQFKHPYKDEVVELVQSMNESHVYVDEHGVEWERVWTIPNAAIDSQNDGTEEGFMKHTQNKKGTVGDLWNASKEASEKRIQKYGHDKVKEKNDKEYSKKRKGMKRRGTPPPDITL